MENISLKHSNDVYTSAVCFQDGASSGHILNVPGLVSMAIFYIFVAAVGIITTCRHSKRQTSTDYILANRNVGLFIGIVSLSATWVGGGFLNGTAEMIFTPGYGHGLFWTQAPVCASLSLVVGGLLFARHMREEGYITLLDPFLLRYGKLTSALLFIAGTLPGMFYTSAIMSALGSTLAVMTGLQFSTSVTVSVAVTVFYTMFGGLRSIVYTDVLQICAMVFGLWLAIPFALNHHAVKPLAMTAQERNSWIGRIDGGIWPLYYIDTALALMLGGIPWQDYFQRVLSQRTSHRAVIVSVAGGCACLLLSVPAYLIGAIAASTDWNMTDYSSYGSIPVPLCDRKLALPMVLQFLTPLPVSVLGLGAISAAVMSSADSSILSPGSMFSNNVYKPIRDTIAAKYGHQMASDREMLWITKLIILVVAVCCLLITIFSNAIYGLWYLSHDLGYFTLFPQLVSVVYYRSSNSYGSVSGLLVSIFLRLSAGDPLLGIPALIEYPYYDRTTGIQLFPYRTVSAMFVIVVIVGVSMVTNKLPTHGYRSILLAEKTISGADQQTELANTELNANVLRPSEQRRQELPEKGDAVP